MTEEVNLEDKGKEIVKEINFEEMANDFNDAKAAYVDVRNKEHKKLKDFLKNDEQSSFFKDYYFKLIEKNSGSGKSDYSSKQRIEPYDLSNWKWVEIRDCNNDDRNVLITFNMFHKDEDINKSYAILDRFYNKWCG